MLVRAIVGLSIVTVGATVSASAFFDTLRWTPLDEGLLRSGLHAAPLTGSLTHGDIALQATGDALAPENGPGWRSVPEHVGLPAGPRPPESYAYTHRAERGDTLGGMLLRVGVAPEEARAAIDALKTQFDPRHLRVGQDVTITLAPGASDDERHRLDGLSFDIAFPHRMIVNRRADGGFEVTKGETEVQTVLDAAAGTIRSSLFGDGDRLGVPAPVLADLLKIYSWDVDFQRQVRRGDTFALLYESYVDEDGAVLGGGKIVAAVLTLGGQRTSLFRYRTADGEEDFYDETGKSVRKALLKTPIDGARLTSRFGMRRHPVLGYSRMHRGVDFAAPPGTPIYAAGDGTVEVAGRQRGYGRYIKIQHRAGYATAYAHMSRFAKGIRAGARVEQGDVIGYVGSSGLSTGPHLHYEILINGKQVNPVNVKMPAGRELAGRELQQFEATVDAAMKRLATLARDGAPARVADAGGAD